MEKGPSLLLGCPGPHPAPRPFAIYHPSALLYVTHITVRPSLDSEYYHLEQHLGYMYERDFVL